MSRLNRPSRGGGWPVWRWAAHSHRLVAQSTLRGEQFAPGATRASNTFEHQVSC
jgi:hypothetical protein